jgi:hypothetical protein
MPAWLAAIGTILGKLLDFIMGMQKQASSRELAESERRNAALRAEVMAAEIKLANRDAERTSPKAVEEAKERMTADPEPEKDKDGVVWEDVKPEEGWSPNKEVFKQGGPK